MLVLAAFFNLQISVKLYFYHLALEVEHRVQARNVKC